MTFPRIIVAGTHSGSGKTTVVMGIASALSKRGLRVQTFKTGPDYIDPGYHSVASGRPCRNLDSMLIDQDPLLELFHRSSEGMDLSLVEGVMGLFDGATGLDDRGSAASLARISRTPVVLVVDARSMARSAAAVVHGFASFDRSVNVAGVILNRIGSPRHFDMIKEAIQSSTKVAVLGYIPRDESISLPERHLGLVPAWEMDTPGLERLSSLVEDNIDLDELLKIALSSEAYPEHRRDLFSAQKLRGKVKVAVAMDRAFHFYYQDNLDILSHMGAEIVPFSPLEDSSLPEASAIYIGGGFPELTAEELESNHTMREDILKKAQLGMPIFAECGGLMYLVDRIETPDGVDRSMVGIFSGKVSMGKRLRALGYCHGETLRNTLFGPKGRAIKGHVFHWSSYEGPEDTSWALRLTKGDTNTMEGLAYKNVLASYLHVHFASDLSIAESFISSALEWQKKANRV
ncbi:cobyrinate a,c-diamide synthase [Dethiosulfovibrio salsuginis]|uniref:Cobyrinate a,c-diamide synthase n=1 Tax=Dethiosulfovibrio salsuginis TaxID=561720 RepID=A0A1X7KDA8_9BACT|nr:cobyrinate a,c-diamide synthase [Dethiosulfovibrio salsuginis]SMG38860.1 hydrogenobyrinic acid a,c-diamide synthase (glutamine-hydrolysing) /cobyrinate a,c-diamide synthase [Dethiosulfovibrio salsuginis]